MGTDEKSTRSQSNNHFVSTSERRGNHKRSKNNREFQQFTSVGNNTIGKRESGKKGMLCIGHSMSCVYVYRCYCFVN